MKNYLHFSDFTARFKAYRLNYVKWRKMGKSIIQHDFTPLRLILSAYISTWNWYLLNMISVGGVLEHFRAKISDFHGPEANLNWVKK